VVKAERLIEQLKEGYRSVKASIPWRMNHKLRKELVVFVNGRRNLVFTNTLTDKVSPKELFIKRKVNYEKDYALGFGDYVQAYDPNVKKNSSDPRTMGCIAFIHAETWLDHGFSITLPRIKLFLVTTGCNTRLQMS
jgi:hypothetical protein